MNIYYTTQFKKDYKKVKKQNKDITKIEFIIKELASGKVLDQKYKDHQLSGRWKEHRDCHIEPDWILIYRLTPNSLVLERTGSHSELFE